MSQDMMKSGVVTERDDAECGIGVEAGAVPTA